MTTSHGITKGLNRKENRGRVPWQDSHQHRSQRRRRLQERDLLLRQHRGHGPAGGHEELRRSPQADHEAGGREKSHRADGTAQSKRNHKDYMCDNSKWGVALVKMVGSEHFKLLYDIYHMQIDEGDVIASIRENKDYYGHYHTGGVPGARDRRTQELYYPRSLRRSSTRGSRGISRMSSSPSASRWPASTRR
jgi:hydroxypyruvate isomerase